MINEAARDLKNLKILHYVAAAFSALAACVQVVSITVAVLIAAGVLSTGEDSALFGRQLLVIVGVFFLVNASLALVSYRLARAISGRTSHRTCVRLAYLECLMLPIGPFLGLTALSKLDNDSVKLLFIEKELDLDLAEKEVY